MAPPYALSTLVIALFLEKKTSDLQDVLFLAASSRGTERYGRRGGRTVIVLCGVDM